MPESWSILDPPRMVSRRSPPNAVAVGPADHEYNKFTTVIDLTAVVVDYGVV